MSQGEGAYEMTVILANFGFPLIVEHRKRLIEMLSLENDGDLDLRERETMFNPNQSFVRQATKLVDALKLSDADWRSGEVVAMLPGHPSAAIAIVLELQRRLGKTPRCVRLIRVSKVPRRFEVAEIMRFE